MGACVIMRVFTTSMGCVHMPAMIAEATPTGSGVGVGLGLQLRLRLRSG